jgi:glycosyltransferase involved in cell wall biosynthesis
MPAVSVIVPTRNRNHLLPRCLHGLYAQSFRDFEVVLVDNNPPESRVANDPSLNGLLADRRLRLIENAEPRNAAMARNCGLREARGDWITYVDDDDAYRPLKLEKQFRRTAQSGAAIVSCGVTYRTLGRARERNTDRTEFVGDELLLQFPAMPAIFHRRTDVFFNEALSAVEDAYFYLELIQRFKMDRVANVPEALVDVYLHQGPRVTLNADAGWQGSLAVSRNFGPHYSKRATEVYLLRSRLLYCKVQRGTLRELLGVSWRLAMLQGRKEARAIAGAFLFQIPFFRPFLVT